MVGGDPLALSISVFRALRLVTTFDGRFCHRKNNLILLIFTTVASCTILIWDYILTFRMEADLVWTSKWNFLKGLYLFQRYLTFIDISLLLHYKTGVGLTKTECRDLYYAIGAMMAIGFAASEMVLTFRTWAVWKRDQRLTIILPILYALVWGSVFVIQSLYVSSVTFGDPPYPGFRGCFLTHAANLDLILFWVGVIIWDTLMLVLMLIPGVRAYRGGGNSALMKAVYRDGVVYYLYLFTLSFLNILLIKILPIQYRHLLVSAERVLHSTLASRVLLRIRAQAGVDPGGSDGQTKLTQIAFHRTKTKTETEGNN